MIKNDVTELKKLGFEKEGYNNLRKSTKEEQEKEREGLVLSYSDDDTIWTDSTVVTTD